MLLLGAADGVAPAPATAGPPCRKDATSVDHVYSLDSSEFAHLSGIAVFHPYLIRGKLLQLDNSYTDTKCAFTSLVVVPKDLLNAVDMREFMTPAAEDEENQVAA
jgi:hypothetical protein